MYDHLYIIHSEHICVQASRHPFSWMLLVKLVSSPSLSCRYIGHGGGQEYISSHERSKLSCKAVMVLMGCKTAKLAHCGQLDGSGVALDYLLAGW